MLPEKLPEFEFEPSTSSEFSCDKTHRPISDVTRKSILEHNFHIFLTHPVADFCTLGFAAAPIGARWPHSRGRRKWFSTYRPDPLGPVIKLTCQTFLTHPVADFCTLGSTPSPKGPKWPHPTARPRWFTAYRPDPGWPVIKLTCQPFLTHTVADFCILGFASSPIGQDGRTLVGSRDGSRSIAWPLLASVQTRLSDLPHSPSGRFLHPWFRPLTHRTKKRWFSAYRPDPWGPEIKLTCQTFLTHPVADFGALGFTPLSIGPRWRTLVGGLDGSRPIGLTPLGQWSN